jgi:carboxylate-amine ligase
MSNDYQIGIEEEYFVVDLRTRNVRATMPKKFYRTAKALLKDRLTSEMLQCQVEVMTSPCKSISQARQELAQLRSVLAEQAGRHDLGIMAASTHPIAPWREQKQTPKERYSKVMGDIQMLGLRNMLCGMHVHVELPDPERRVEVMYRTIPFLPALVALSTSSPFWQGQRTGLLGYRLAAYDELPRTGLPELFRTKTEYETYVDALVSAGLIENASFIWWAMRPSLWHPTLELRIPDVCTRMEDGALHCGTLSLPGTASVRSPRAKCRSWRGRSSLCAGEQMARPALWNQGKLRRAWLQGGKDDERDGRWVARPVARRCRGARLRP